MSVSMRGQSVLLSALCVFLDIHNCKPQTTLWGWSVLVYFGMLISEEQDFSRKLTTCNTKDLLWDSPWLCWSVLLPGTQWCQRHQWGWAVCVCWLTTSPTGCHSCPNALPYHSDWMRCPGAGPHADLSDDHNSTWMRGRRKSEFKTGILHSSL